MRALKPVLISAAVIVAFTSGTVLAEGGIMILPARSSGSELDAAQKSLDVALGHLRKVPNPQNRENVRAMNFIRLAQQQLQSEGMLYPIN